ncbi:MAG: hypothetical protein QM783_15890 [Phycisphaerales bacterium]
MVQSLSDLFRQQARQLHRALLRQRRLGGNVEFEEETITAVLLAKQRGLKAPFLHVERFNRHQERRNGADWEWVFEQAGRVWQVRVQAKKYVPNRTAFCSADYRYKKLAKPPAGIDKRIRNQASNLIVHATAAGADAVYVFYVADHRPRQIADVATMRAGEQEADFGISVVPAEEIRWRVAARQRWWKLLSLGQIGPLLVPWHRLFESLPSGALGAGVVSSPVTLAHIRRAFRMALHTPAADNGGLVPSDEHSRDTPLPTREEAMQRCPYLKVLWAGDDADKTEILEDMPMKPSWPQALVHVRLD